MYMQKSIISLAVIASSFFTHAAVAADETMSDSVSFGISAERRDVPTLSVGLGQPLDVYFDFGENKFKTIQPLGLNIELHNPSATFDSLDVVVASVTGNGHKLKGPKDSAYSFYMANNASGTSVGTYKVPQGTSNQDPFSGLTALTSDELAKAGLGVFNGLVNQEVDVRTTAYLSLESDAADTTLTDGVYVDNASFYMQTTWKNYVVVP